VVYHKITAAFFSFFGKVKFRVVAIELNFVTYLQKQGRELH